MENFVKENIGVLITSHPKQHIWMDTAFGSWSGFEGHIVLGYDHVSFEDMPVERWMPPVTSSFVTGKPAGQYGHFRGELWQLKQGSQIILNDKYDYIYKTAADNTCYRWRNLLKCYRHLKNRKVDILMCGTTQIFARTEVFAACMDLWSEKIERCGGAELFLKYCIKELNVRVEHIKIPWWNELLGLVHLQGEYALNMGISIFDTWAIGQKWGPLYGHIDLDKRIEYLKPEIRSKYEHLIREEKESS